MPNYHSVEYPLYPPSSDIIKIVHLTRKSLNLISDLQIINPWNDQRMNKMLNEIVYLVCYQIEQIEGILCIAESNLYLYPSAFVISRTVLEKNILIEWLLQPEDESERLVRYIRYLNSQLYKRHTFDEDILNSDIPTLEKDILTKNKDNISRDISDMKDSAINHGVSSEIISRAGNLPNIADMIKVISPLKRQTNFKIAYYTLSKFSHGMRQSIYRYLDPNFNDKDPVPNWYYPFDLCTYIFLSVDRLIQRFGNDELNKSIDIDDLGAILSEIDLAKTKVFRLD